MTRTKYPKLFFDIETIALPGVENFLPEPKVDARIKDPEKIRTAKEEKAAEMIERAGLDFDLAQVRLITMQIGTDGSPMVGLVPTKPISKPKLAKLSKLVPDKGLFVGTEAEVIKYFWKKYCMANGASVGYNIAGFDLPMLLHRSMDLGICPGIQPNLAKYRTEPTTDLMGILSGWSWGEGAVKKLKWLAKRYGFEVLAPEAEGSQVAEMSDEELVIYGLSDLHVTVQLYQKMNNVYFTHLD